MVWLHCVPWHRPALDERGESPPPSRNSVGQPNCKAVRSPWTFAFASAVLSRQQLHYVPLSSCLSALRASKRDHNPANFVVHRAAPFLRRAHRKDRSMACRFPRGADPPESMKKIRIIPLKSGCVRGLIPADLLCWRFPSRPATPSVIG